MNVTNAAGADVDAATFAGHWEGVFKAGNQEMRLVFHVDSAADGTWNASMDSPDQGAYRIPASSCKVNGGELVCEWPDLNAKLVAELTADGKELNGTWHQGVKIPAKLLRAENNRPQEPLPPLSYRVQDVVINNPIAGIDLAGTLTVPQGQGPFPALVLITGSGPQNRDQEILGHKIFKVIADHLTKKGIAVLRCDDRGVGASQGKFASATIFEFASDTEASVAFLKSIPEIDPEKIGLLGHSEGGTVAAIVASRSADVSFLVLMAAAGVSGEETLYEQSRLILKSNGASLSLIEMNEAVQKGIFRVIKEVDDLREAQKQFAVVRDQIEAKYKTAMNFDESQWKAWRNGFDADAVGSFTPWFKTFLTLEPKDLLSKVRVPVLAINGELDTQVSAKQQLPAIEAALKDGGNADVKTIVLPKLNHQFQTCVTGSPAEYGQITETIAPIALETITAWLLKR